MVGLVGLGLERYKLFRMNDLAGQTNLPNKNKRVRKRGKSKQEKKGRNEVG